MVNTNNSLAHIINWLKDGYMVCIYELETKLFFKSQILPIKKTYIIF